MTINQKKPDLFLSMPHPCSYLPDRMSSILFLDPQHALDGDLYGDYVRVGFRRSGDLVYRPHCQGCAACVPVRIPVQSFRPRRGQTRAWNRNRDIAVTATEAAFNPEHFALYQRYQAARHPGSGMDDADPDKYVSFLASRHMRTVFYELRLGRRLLGVAVADILGVGLSAVYTFYEPSESRRGLGVYAILWEIAEARRLGLAHVYLGYWIAQSSKMSYKADFRPLEMLDAGRWVEIPRDGPAARRG